MSAAHRTDFRARTGYPARLGLSYELSSGATITTLSTMIVPVIADARSTESNSGAIHFLPSCSVARNSELTAGWARRVPQETAKCSPWPHLRQFPRVSKPRGHQII
jgi:hypothetical protein